MEVRIYHIDSIEIPLFCFTILYFVIKLCVMNQRYNLNHEQNMVNIFYSLLRYILNWIFYFDQSSSCKKESTFLKMRLMSRNKNIRMVFFLLAVFNHTFDLTNEFKLTFSETNILD